MTAHYPGVTSQVDYCKLSKSLISCFAKNCDIRVCLQMHTISKYVILYLCLTQSPSVLPLKTRPCLTHPRNRFFVTYTVTTASFFKNYLTKVVLLKSNKIMLSLTLFAVHRCLFFLKTLDFMFDVCMLSALLFMMPLLGWYFVLACLLSIFIHILTRLASCMMKRNWNGS